MGELRKQRRSFASGRQSHLPRSQRGGRHARLPLLARWQPPEGDVGRLGEGGHRPRVPHQQGDRGRPQVSRSGWVARTTLPRNRGRMGLCHRRARRWFSTRQGARSTITGRAIYGCPPRATVTRSRPSATSPATSSSRLLTDWIDVTPKDMLALSFGVPKNVFDAFPKGQLGWRIWSSSTYFAPLSAAK
jgi:hypothetical protein